MVKSGARKSRTGIIIQKENRRIKADAFCMRPPLESIKLKRFLFLRYPCVWFRIYHRSKFARGKDNCGGSGDDNLAALVLTPAVDIDAVFSGITIFLDYFAFAPAGITEHTEFADFGAGFPQESVITHPVRENHGTPSLEVLTGRET
jgi:hypothetical protein